MMTYYFDPCALIDIFERKPELLKAYFLEFFVEGDKEFLLSEHHAFELVRGCSDVAVRCELLDAIWNLPGRQFIAHRNTIIAQELEALNTDRIAQKIFIDGPAMQDGLANAKAILRGEPVSENIREQFKREGEFHDEAMRLAEQIREQNIGGPVPTTIAEVKDGIYGGDILEAITGVKIEHEVVKRFIGNADRYPSLNTRAEVHAFLIWKALSIADWKGKHLIPDLKHVAEAAYADVFVTTDQDAAKAARMILHPSVKVLGVEEVLGR